MTRFLFFVVLGFAITSQFHAATCVSTGNGAWNNPAIWSCGHIPVCGDSICIQAGHTLTVTSQLDYTGCADFRLTIKGTLIFQTGNKLDCPCDTRIYIFPGGLVQPGNGGGNSNYIEICSDIVWSAGDGAITSASCLPPSAPGCGGVLPIELVDFSALLNNARIDITWSTATEKNNDHFDIERSKDAASFEKISSVPTKATNGNSSALLKYSTTDNSPLSDISYYRLRQIDKSNQDSYSKIVSVNVIKAKNIRFLIYPNPNNGEFTADISGIENNHEVKIILKDSNGNLTYESSFFIQEINTKLRIVPSNKLPNGIYFCTLLLEGVEYSVKVLVN